MNMKLFCLTTFSNFRNRVMVVCPNPLFLAMKLRCLGEKKGVSGSWRRQKVEAD